MINKKGTLKHKRWIIAILLVALLTAVMPVALAGNQTGTIQNPNGDLVNLRAWADKDAPILCTLQVGTKVEITGQSGSWYAVWAGSTSGYVHADLVAVHNGSWNAPTQKTATLICDASLRESASKDACVIARLWTGTKVTVLCEGETWTQVSYGSCYGYVLTSALNIGKPAPKPTPTPAPICKPSEPSWEHSKPQKPSVPVWTQNANATVRTFNGGNLNLRAWTSTNADIIASIANGTRVRILTHGDTWCKVQVGSLVGYMSSKYLVYDGGNPHYDRPNNNGSKTASIQSSGANLRKSPSLNSYILSQLSCGTSVQLLGVGTDWVRVNANGTHGYIKTDLVKLPAGVSPHKTVVNNGSYVNLREGAGYDYRVLKRIPHGSAATVVIPYEIWSQVVVKDGQGYLGGYMMNSFLK